MKGLIVYILRNTDRGDCTNGGLSATATKALLVGPGVPEVFEAHELPILVLKRREIRGIGEYLHTEPLAGKDTSTAGWMHGGNFCYTSDSRFPNRYPLPIHDRQESSLYYRATND